MAWHSATSSLVFRVFRSCQNGPTPTITWLKCIAAVRDSYDNLTADYNQLDERTVEQQRELKSLSVERDELAGGCDELSTECDELIAAYDPKQIEHQGVIKHYQDRLRKATSASTSHPCLPTKLPDMRKLTNGKDPTIDHWCHGGH